jgi:glutamate synthase (NADPH/NADH) small chain
VTTLAIGQRLPDERPEGEPWPLAPRLFEVSSAHEEGGEREFLVSTVEFLGDDKGNVRALRIAETEFRDGTRVPKAGTEREIPADLVLLSLGFTGTDASELAEQSEVVVDRGLAARTADFETNVPGVFVAGDAGRGASLVVWAIAEGRAVAAQVDTYLTGSSVLPAPVRATDRPFALYH